MAAGRIAARVDERRIDDIFAAVNQCSLPGAAVGIAVAGKPAYRKGFGLASIELPLVLSPSMRMRLGSTTKHFAALAFMLLCEQGKASIDDRIGTYLPELHPIAHKVTFRQLMGNTSGLRDACDLGLRFSGSGHPITNADLLDCYREIDDVNAESGTAWIYNNGGYVLLSLAIERISGQPLEEMLREHIFAPIGLHDTQVRRFDTDFVPNSASLHMMHAGRYQKCHFGIDFAGAGAMVSTVDDMLRWLAHMDAPKVGTAETWSLIKTPQMLPNGTSTGYGFGLMIDRYRGVETLAHPGGGMGSNAQMLKVPAAKLDVVVLANRHDVQSMQLVTQILDACLPDLEPAVDGSDHPFVSGTFRSAATGRVVQLIAKDQEQIVSVDGFDLPFVHRADGSLHPASIWSFLKRSVKLTGDPAHSTSIYLDDFGNRDEFVRVQLPTSRSLDELAGRYRAPTAQVEALICETANGWRFVTTGQFGSAPYDLECIGESVLRARPATPMNLGGIVSFDRDRQGFRFFSYGTRALPFHRVLSA
jgi:D-aminopeptidase